MTNEVRNTKTVKTKLFSERLSHLLIECGVRQSDIAKELGVTRQAINSWASGATVPNLDKIRRLAQFLNVTADYLVGATDIKSRDQNIYNVCTQTNISEIAAFNFMKAIELNPAISSLIDGLSKEILLYALSDCSRKNKDDSKEA